MWLNFLWSISELMRKEREREREREGALCLWWCIEKDVYDATRKRAEILFLKEQE